MNIFKQLKKLFTNDESTFINTEVKHIESKLEDDNVRTVEYDILNPVVSNALEFKIREMIAEGKVVKDIAKELGIGYSNVYYYYKKIGKCSYDIAVKRTIGKDNKKAISGKYIHSRLKLTTSFSKWVNKRIEQNNLKQGKDYEKITTHTGGKKEYDCYFTIDVVKGFLHRSHSPYSVEVLMDIQKENK